MYTEEEIKKLREEEETLTEEALLLLLSDLSSTLNDLEKELRSFYQKYGKDGVITYSEAKKWISSKNHTKRIVGLGQNISDLFDAAFKSFEKTFTKHLRDIVMTEADFWGVKLDVDDILDTIWSPDGISWRNRLLAYQNKWTTVTNNKLKISVLKQDSVLDILVDAAERGDAMEKILKRFWRTESNAMSSVARKKSYEGLGYKYYRFLHLDGCTCEECSDMDGRVFPVSEYKVGVTANPLHPNCDDTTEPLDNYSE